MTHLEEKCVACEPGDIFPKPDDDLALCTEHWNWWLGRYMASEDLPPCAAHLIVGAG